MCHVCQHHVYVCDVAWVGMGVCWCLSAGCAVLPADITAEIVEEELANLLQVQDLLNDRGIDASSAAQAANMLRSLSSGASIGGFGMHDDVDSSHDDGGQPTDAELRERIRIVKQAVKDHRAAGEAEHVSGAINTLRDLEDELARRERAA